MKVISDIARWNCAHKSVFLRADLNVPLQDGIIIDDARLKAIIPTIDLLCEKQAIIILATHIGSPKNQEEKLSTQWLIPWFQERKYSIHHATTFAQAQDIKHYASPGTIILIENVRFFAGEKQPTQSFVNELKQQIGRAHV